MRKLSSMGWEELWTRGSQAISKRVDAARRRLGIAASLPAMKARPSAHPSFFFEASELPVLCDRLRQQLPAQAAQIITQADQICRHRFDLLGYEQLEYGPEIDWQADLVHHQRAPRKPWHRIRFLDFEQVGDPKIIWELNRHQHLVTLAKAYALTARKNYALECVRQWRHWQEHNPYPLGINWASSLEVAFRSLSWLWMREFLAGCDCLPQAFASDLVQALGLHGRHIARYLSTYFSPNTHLLGEAAGLFFIGALCPEIASAETWRETGWQLILRESERQVASDGFHFEHSTYYHVYALDFLLHSRILAHRNRIPIPDRLDQTLKSMLDALCALCRNGPPPRFGDDDGGRVFDPRRNRAEHLADPLATGAALFNRADYRAVAGGLREETLWLLAEEGVTRFDALPSTTAPPVSESFPETGLYLMAGPDPPHQLTVDAGAQGAGVVELIDRLLSGRLDGPTVSSPRR